MTTTPTGEVVQLTEAQYWRIKAADAECRRVELEATMLVNKAQEARAAAFAAAGLALDTPYRIDADTMTATPAPKEA